MLISFWRIGLMIESCEPDRAGLVSAKESWCFERSVPRPRRVSTMRDSLLLPPTMVTVRAVAVMGSLVDIDVKP